MNPIVELDPVALKQRLDNGTAVVIDVREADEYAAGHLPGARLNPVSRFNPRAVPTGDDPTPVLYCRSGTRSGEAARQLLSSGVDQVYHMKGGILAWQQAGFETVAEARRGPISLMRQVQIVAGSLVVLGLLLAALLSPWFALLSGFVGAGLVFAGVSGTCMMAELLAKLPYNRPNVTSPAQTATTH